MPRYASQNLAAVNPDYRKTHNINAGGGTNNRYTYGKSVFVASGTPLFADGFTIRLLPIYDDSAKDDAGNRVFVPFREGRGETAFGDWGRLMTVAHWVGNPGACFIVHDGNPQLNIYDSPYHILRNVAYNNSSLTKKGLPHPVYGKLFDELLSKNFVPKSHVGSLRAPEPILFVSASAVEIDQAGNPVLLAFSDDPKKNARIIGLKRSCFESFYAALATIDDVTGTYMAGDMLSFEAAQLATFVGNEFKSAAKNHQAYSIEGQTGIQVPRKCQQAGPVIHGNSVKPSSMTYRAIVHDAYNGRPVSLEQYAERIVAETKSWDDYLHLPSYGEQAELIAGSFDREILEFAWQEHPEYLRLLPRGTTTSAGNYQETAPEDLQEDTVPRAVAAPAYQPRPVPVSVPVNTPAPAPLEAELSPDEAAQVDDMFAAAPPAQAPAASSPRPPVQNTADIIARARAAAMRRN